MVPMPDDIHATGNVHSGTPTLIDARETPSCRRLAYQVRRACDRYRNWRDWIGSCDVAAGPAMTNPEPLRPRYLGNNVPQFACWRMPTRHCPAVYGDVCGERRPCARFESQAPEPWVPEIRFYINRAI